MRYERFNEFRNGGVELNLHFIIIILLPNRRIYPTPYLTYVIFIIIITEENLKFVN